MTSKGKKMNSLMRLKKIELIRLIDMEKRRHDELFDRYEQTREELKDIETYEDEFHQLQEIKDLLNEMKIAKERESWGVITSREDFDKAFDKLMDYAN